MHPHPGPPSRRVHGAGFRATVLAACRQPGASVAAVAPAHGPNVDLVRKWLVGRGLKRSGLDAPREASRVRAPMEPVTGAAVELAAVAGGAADRVEAASG